MTRHLEPGTITELLDHGSVSPVLERLRHGYRFEGEPGTILQFRITDRSGFDHGFVLRDDGVEVAPGWSGIRDAISTTLASYCDFFENRISFQNLIMLGRWRAEGRDRDDPYAFLPFHAALTTLACGLPAFPSDDRASLVERIESSARALPRLAAIDRVRGIDREAFLAQYARTGKPVVIAGVTDESEPSSWSWDAFRALYEGLPYYIDGLGGLCMPATGVISQIEHNRAGVAGKIGLPIADGLERRYRLPSYFLPDRYFRKSQAVLVSCPSLRLATCWHRDLADNFLLQLIGRKRVEICSPAESACFYLRQLPATDANVPFDASTVDGLRPDPETHAEFFKAHIIDCVLEPGDLLYLPCGWLHNVHQVTPSVSINAWLYHPPAAAASEAS
jgi:Cupin-like domain